MNRGGAGLPSPVGVLGGGRMGMGIAHAFVCAGAEVAVVEVDPSAALRARQRIVDSIQQSVDRGSVSEAPKKIASRLVVAADRAALAGMALIVEAVPEDPALKAYLLRAAEAQLGPDAVLATNTSSLSIDELAAVLERPDRFLGLHFFNPVPASQLVEVVTGSATSGELVVSARAWVAELGKTPIVVRDSPGFASSRLGVALALESMRMLEDGVASAEDIDAAVVLGYKHPVGPLRLTDLVGLDVRLSISDNLCSKLGKRFLAPQILRDKVGRGELGKKTGQGFFTW